LWFSYMQFCCMSENKTVRSSSLAHGKIVGFQEVTL
jgi:hypothetical protein